VLKLVENGMEWDFTFRAFARWFFLSGVAQVSCVVIIREKRTDRGSMVENGGAVIGRRA
jgi:hypothetical protein